MRLGCRISCAVVLAVCGVAAADRPILAETYLDKLHGMWLGEILGNYAGRDVEGSVARGGLSYTIDWPAIVQTDPWDGDDDTCLEYLYMHVLSGSADPTAAEIGQAWRDHVKVPAFYVANKQARWLIDDGLNPPQTGSVQKNACWYAIDSQITTESLGAAAPGMRQRAADLAGRFGSVTNDGYPVHAAQYYAAMYAAAAFESDVEELVEKGLEVVPQTSRTHQVIQDVRDWYADDKLDAALDWRATHEKLYDKYAGADSMGRYRSWIESTVNTGLTTMAVLYGQGDFKDTVEIGVLGGFDADCNPATAGGLIGLISGYSGLPADLTSPATDNYLASSWLKDIPLGTTVSAIAAGFQAAAEQQILECGGSITGEGPARTYHLPDEDNVAPPAEKPDPAGPKGLVAQVLAAGGTAAVSASVEYHNPSNDAQNLEGIIDGITDVSYNGHLPYSTYDAVVQQPEGGDYYQLDFDRDITFTSVIFHEGEIKLAHINSDPRVDEPRGGYFVNLTVEVGSDGQFAEVANLHLSEPLDYLVYQQQIELAFHPMMGDAIRIRGEAGGTQEFTSILELEAYGRIGELHAGDADLDDAVDVGDLGILGASYGQSGKTWTDGDFTGDGIVNIGDLGILGANYGYVGGGSVPEPATLAMLALGAALIARHRWRSAATAQGPPRPPDRSAA